MKNRLPKRSQNGLLSRTVSIAVLFVGGLLVSGAISCGPPEEEVSEDTRVAGRGGECSEQNDCFECDGCRTRYGEVCLEGSCWLSGDLDEEDPDGYPLVGSHLAYIELPRGVDPTRMRSAAIRVIHPARADGEAAECEDLLADPVAVDEDAAWNRLRVLQPALVLSGSDNVAVVSVGHIPIGEDRLFLVRVHSQNNGQGNLLAKGCTSGVTVDLGMDQRTVVEVHQIE